ncbi:MAG: glycosyltransferase family 39 protein [Bacteroidota bacterium]|nr:glycosyltransferase family 39 protein [Bacteroidota bacterium]MDP4217802.1 glycosyltransferase family 39 protein [Bacteroidota bacterium]
MFIPILEPDGALYATIARSMAQAGDFIDLRVGGSDWLDKPHFPFWVAALSFRAFGINSFAYKFPALLFWAAGGYYTWRLALVLYGRSVARFAVLIYVSAAHLVISNNDVRAEPYLTGLIAGAVYHFFRASRNRSKGGGLHIVAGSALAACATMTKGPFVLVTIGAGLLVDCVRTRDWRQFLLPRWWLALVLIAIFISPELYCLYRQFDMHPEKLIFGRQNVSGIRWFLWDSQFGRFMNNGPIRGSGNPFFFLHTLLWAFAPWSILLYYAIVHKSCKWRVANRAPVPGDFLCLGAALISFSMFSLSKFQLPHYLNILFPFFSILTAEKLDHLEGQVSRRAFTMIQNGIALLTAILLCGLAWWFHFTAYKGLIVLLLALSGLAAFLVSPRMKMDKGAVGKLQTAVMRSFWLALIAYAFLNFCLYPAMMHYQAGMVAGKSLRSRDGIPPQEVYMLREAPSNYSFTFYCPGTIRYLPMDSLRINAGAGPVWVFLSSTYMDSLRSRGYNIQALRRFPNFHVSGLTAGFFDWRTRPHALDAWFLIKLGDSSGGASRDQVSK